VYGLEWQAFSDSMHEIDKEAFIELMNRLKHLAEADSEMGNPNLFESVMIAIFVEHQRDLYKLND
jgi:hypothetical protein